MGKTKCFIWRVMPPPTELLNFESRLVLDFCFYQSPQPGALCRANPYTLWWWLWWPEREDSLFGKKYHRNTWTWFLMGLLNLCLNTDYTQWYSENSHQREWGKPCEWRLDWGETGNPSWFFLQKSSFPWNRCEVKMVRFQSTLLLRMRWTECWSDWDERSMML